MSKSKGARRREANRVARQLATAKPRSAQPAPLGMRQTTPRQPLSARVRQLCARISKADPVLLPFTDLSGRARQCHMNVLHRVRTHGGKRRNGWLIWESAMFAEASFHCVWESPDGELVDLTPRDDGEEHILFLPDPETRLTVGPHGGYMMPTNRTTSPATPFTFAGLPFPHPTAEVTASADTLAYCRELGIDVLAVCFCA
jgi:hypothetical protein